MPLKRKNYSGKNFNNAHSIEELHKIACRRIPNFALEYVVGGAEDEATLAWNREALKAIRFIPNTLVDTSSRHQRIKLFDDFVV